MIGALIGAAASTIGSVVGSAMSSAASRRAERERLAGIAKQRTRNDNLLNYSMGARAAAQTHLNQLSDDLRERKAARTGAKNVIGGTQAAVQAGDAADAKVLGDATETAVAQGLDDRREAMRNYTAAQNELDAQEANVKASAAEARSQNVANATKSLAATAGQVIGGIDSVDKAAKNTGTGTQTQQKGTSLAYNPNNNPFTPKGSQQILKDNLNDALKSQTKYGSTDPRFIDVDAKVQQHKDDVGALVSATNPFKKNSLRDSFNNALDRQRQRIKSSINNGTQRV